MNKYLLKIIKTAVGLLLLIGLIYCVKLDKLIETFKNLSLFYIILLLAISFVLILISTIKWQILIEKLGEKIPLLKLFSLYFIGYFVNLFLPSFLGGDLARSITIGKKIGQHKALTATFLERYTGFFAMLFLSFIFMFFVDYIPIRTKTVVAILFFASIIITILSLSEKLLKKFSFLPYSEKFLPHFQKIQESLLVFKDDKKLIFQTLFLSIVFHCITVLNTAVAGYAIGWEDLPLFSLFIVLPLIFLISCIPISPNGLGVQEGAFTFFLMAVGATKEQALAVALILRLKGYILGLVGGVLYWGNSTISSTKASATKTSATKASATKTSATKASATKTSTKKTSSTKNGK
ncbi:MAG: lysylphosphatidylglycerol synthase transmembrane domain-containing protein [Bdellovibrionota bacterium]